MLKFLKSFVFAFKGLYYAFKTQLNFKIHCLAATISIVLGFYFKISSSEWLWLCLSITIVLILELLNTAIEVLVDFICPGIDERAGAIKDIGAAAVLIAAIFALTVGAIIFLPKIFS